MAKRYGDFHRLHHQLRMELPGKVLPVLPKKNRSDHTAPSLTVPQINGAESESSSISSSSTQLTLPPGQSMPQMGDSLEPSPASLAVRGRARQDPSYSFMLPC